MLIRRSNLLVSLTDAAAIRAAGAANADAVTLDLGPLVAPARAPEALDRLGAALAVLATSGAEIFLRLNSEQIGEGLEAAAVSGVAGVVVPRIDSPADVMVIASELAHYERARELDQPKEIIAVFASALGIWHARAIVSSSPRVRQAWFDDEALAASLEIVLSPDCDPLEFARGRMISETIAVRVQPIGTTYALVGEPQQLSSSEFGEKVVDSRNLGFKGVFCQSAHWVEAINRAFTPTQEEIEYAKRVREVFAEGVARGTAAVPLDGRMVDVPVDVRAAAVLAHAAACADRDQAKATARAAR